MFLTHFSSVALSHALSLSFGFGPIFTSRVACHMMDGLKEYVPDTQAGKSYSELEWDGTT